MPQNVDLKKKLPGGGATTATTYDLASCHAPSMPLQTLPPALPHYKTSLEVPVAAQGHPAPQHGTAAASEVAAWRRWRRSETPCCQPCWHAPPMPLQNLPPPPLLHIPGSASGSSGPSCTPAWHSNSFCRGGVAAVAAQRDPLLPVLLAYSGHLPPACYPPTQHPSLSYTSLPSPRPDGTSTAAHTSSGQHAVPLG